MNRIDGMEEVVDFRSGSCRLWGIVTRPETPAAAQHTAVLILVGGPQYRVGSHRQFVLLARGLARAGYPTLRFDYAGMGDSEGDLCAFDSAGPDIHAALQALGRTCPSARRFVVWGLCDAASAALMFAAGDPRVAGIVAANPWARSESTLAVTRLKYYYATRMLQVDFWRKLFSGGLRWRESWLSFRGSIARALSRRSTSASGDIDRASSFQTSMARGLVRLRGRLLLILSGNDLTAKEFLEFTGSSPDWRGLLENPKVSRVDLSEADHTFSQRRWLDQVIAESIAWLDHLDPSLPMRRAQ